VLAAQAVVVLVQVLATAQTELLILAQVAVALV